MIAIPGAVATGVREGAVLHGVSLMMGVSVGGRIAIVRSDRIEVVQNNREVRIAVVEIAAGGGARVAPGYDVAGCASIGSGRTNADDPGRKRASGSTRNGTGRVNQGRVVASNVVASGRR